MDVHSFDNLEDMFAYMQRNEREANARLAPEQQQLTWGSHFAVFRPWDRLVIFGYCLTRIEFLASEQDALAEMGENPYSGENQGELIDGLTRIINSHERGYLFGWCYSVAEPDGELGSTHRDNAWPISTALFEAARAVDWTPARLGPALADLDAAYQAFRAHVSGAG